MSNFIKLVLSCFEVAPFWIFLIFQNKNIVVCFVKYRIKSITYALLPSTRGSINFIKFI